MTFFNQGLTGVFVGFSGDYVACHPPGGFVLTPHLFAAGPRRLAGRVFAARQACVFLQLIGAVERRNIGRRGQACADAEGVDRCTGAEHFADIIFIEAAARQDAYILETTFI